MMSEFNKKILLDNIAFLLKENSMMIGDLESQAGVSTGYISRLAKDEKAKPNIDFVVRTASIFGVSIDMLLNFNITVLAAKDKYIAAFLRRLIEDTLNGKFGWNRELGHVLKQKTFIYDENETHPLFSKIFIADERETDCPYPVERNAFVSHSYGENTRIMDDCYNLELQPGVYLYYMDIFDISKDFEFCQEIWMVKPKNEKFYICSAKDNLLLRDVIMELGTAIRENLKHPIINNDVKSVIDDYMSIPF